MDRPTKALGPNGESVKVALLSDEIAVPTGWGARSLHSEAEASGLTPERMADIMRWAAMGHARAYLTLAMEMEERYLHYRSQLQVRRLAFDAVPASIVAPATVPGKIVDAVHGLIDDPGFREACSDLTDATAKGYSVVEIIWDCRDGLLKPSAYKHRDPRFFQFDPLTLSELQLAGPQARRIFEPLWPTPGQTGESLREGRFIRHVSRTRTGLPIRAGLARSAAWAFIVQSFTLQDWAAFAEIYGIPFRIGKYHAGASEADKRTLLQAVRSIANDAAAIVPQGMEIEFHEVSGSQGEGVFGSFLDYLDRQVSKLVLGQTMTADNGSSLGQAKIHNEVRLDILRADCRAIGSTINRDLIRWFVALNFGPQPAYPRVQFLVSEPEDTKALTDAIARLVPLGLKVRQDQIREKLGLSKPGPNDELLQALAAPPARASAGASTRLASLNADPFAIGWAEWEPLN